MISFWELQTPKICCRTYHVFLMSIDQSLWNYLLVDDMAITWNNVNEIKDLLKVLISKYYVNNWGKLEHLREINVTWICDNSNGKKNWTNWWYSLGKKIKYFYYRYEYLQSWIFVKLINYYHWMKVFFFFLGNLLQPT